MSADNSDITLIDGGFKLLTSTDKIIQNLARDELVEIANWGYDSSSSLNTQSYLNSASSDRISDKFKSSWSRARQASMRLNIEWAINHNTKVELKIGDELQSNRNAIFKQLRERHTLSL